jgi:hypothetical protein
MTIDSVLHVHFSRYPAIRIQDVYKLIHQAALGSEHAVSSAEDARKWLARELADMGTGPDEPAVDPISADGQIVRVHLRPFVAQGGNPEILLEAFLRTASEYHGELRVLQKYWDVARGMDYFSRAKMDNYMQAMQKQNYPAVHHSSEYESLYRPAYRVVWRKLIS